jgi:5-enolpyruvylshikimate-3-phosphate synthase
VAESKEMKSLIKALQRQGFRVKELKSGWIIYPQDRSLPGVTAHKTPSDHRAMLNLLAHLKRVGFDPRA